MSHTPGPWEIASYRNYFGFSVWSPHGPCIAERWYEHERTPEHNDEMKANALLIAAAPEMLEALIETLSIFEGYDEDWDDNSAGRKVLENARAVRAKAEGRP